MGGTLAKRLYYISVGGIDTQEDLASLKETIQGQNDLQQPIRALIRLGASTRVKIGLESLEDANNLIYGGLILNYKIKKAIIPYPKERKVDSPSRPSPRPRTFYREP